MCVMCQMVTANTVCLCLSDACLLPLIVASLGAAKVTASSFIHSFFISKTDVPQ